MIQIYYIFILPYYIKYIIFKVFFIVTADVYEFFGTATIYNVPP